LKGNVYTLCFAAALGTVCALLLTAAGGFTAPYRQANALAEETVNVLKVLNVPFDMKAPAKELLKVREENVREDSSTGQTVYIYAKPGAAAPEAVAMRFSGPGLWGPIKGLLALESDRRTIRGITFYEQEETPGLGGEIAGEEFTGRFAGKAIIGADGKPGFEVAMPGSPQAVNRVDGITGATMTCDKVEAMLNTAIETFVKEK